MGRRKKAGKPAEAALAGGAPPPSGPPLDRGQLADCLSQTSKIAAECNSILQDLLRGRSPQHQDLQRLASQVLMGQSLGLTDLQRKMESQQATLAELLKMLKPAAGAAGLGAPLATDADASAMLATYAAQQPSLSIVKGWDALNLLAAPMRRRKGQKVDRRPDSTGGGSKRERCFGVEAYWRQLDPQQRRRLMRAPLARMAEAVRVEQGEEGVRELAEALALLRQQGGRCAAFWRCPCCDARMLDAPAFVRHLQLYHEEVQYGPDGAAVQCTKCLKQVVGAHYQNEEPGFPTVVLCMSCCWEEQILHATGADDAGSAMQLRMPAPGQRLLPLAAPGDAGETGAAPAWPWLAPDGRRRSVSGDSARSSSDGSSGESSDEFPDGGSSDEDGGGGRAARRRGSAAAFRRQQHARLQQQMEQQVRSAGGLLAAVAARLDALAAAPGAADAAAGGAGEPRTPFERTLLEVVGSAQRLLSTPLAADGGETLDEVARGEMAARLGAPEAGPGREGELQGALRLLSFQELQWLLGYAITTHSPALGPRSAAAGGELLSSSAAAAGYGSSTEGSAGEGSSGSEDEGGGGATPDLGSPGGELLRRRRRRRELRAAGAQLLSYDPGCASVFGFGDAGSNGGQLLLEGGGGAAAGEGGGEALLAQQLAQLGRQPGSLLADLPEGRGLSGSEWLEPHAWWVDHLSHKGWHDFPEDGGAEVYLLQWLYGNVAHAGTDEFHERQRLAAGARGCDNAVMECLAELAEVWRQLAGATARKRHLQSLRDGVREEAAAVRSFEEAGAAALRAQAAEFAEEVGGSGSPRGGAAGAQWSQRALGSLQRFHQLKDESSIRYAQALIDREVAVLELAEEMDLQELQLAAAEVSSIDAALGDARRGVAEAEAERQRLAAEGPAAHRRKDLLDKVNKEAEHRERLQDLQQRVAAHQERVFSEEGFLADARKRHDELAADLEEVRAQLGAFVERRAALDRACHDVLTAQERDRDQALTEAHVDQRIRAVWQVVTCVADAIRLLHDRYAPDAHSKEAERHVRCTGLAQGVCDELEERAAAWCADLDRLRRRAVDLACADASALVEQAALEVIRTQLEDAAVAAREAATLDLLRELDQEEEAKKAAEGKRGKKKKRKGGRAAGEEEDGEEEAGGGGSGSGGESGGGGGEGEDRGSAAAQLLGGLDRLSPELRAEVEYEAALERRRQELEAERLRKEAEMMRLAEEASLRELAQPGGGGKGGKGARGAAAGGAAAGKGAAAAPSSGGKSPQARSAPSTPGKVKAAGAAAAASTGGRVITVAVAAVRGSGGRASGLPSSPPPPPAPAARSPAKPAATPAPVPPAPAAKGGAAAGSAPAQHKCEMRVVSYYGDWRCFCGEANRLWDTCVCGQIPPCRDWVRGRCSYKTRCRFAHPPFELPDSLPRPKSPIAKPSADAQVFSSGRGGAVLPRAASAGKGGTPDAPAVVTALRVVAVPAGAKGGGAAQRPVQLVKPGGRPGATTVTGGGAAAKAAAAPADAAPPPPLKPAPWANVKPGAAVPAAAAHGGGGHGGAPPSSFSLFGGSSPLLLSALGPGGSEPGLASLGPEAAAPAASGPPGAASAPPAVPLGAFGGGGAGLFGPDIFAPAPPRAAADAQHAALLQHQQAAHAPSAPLSPTQLAGGGSMPHSPLLLSPQRLPAASPSALHPSAPAYLPSPQHAAAGLPSQLGELSLGSPSAPAPGAAVPGMGAGLGLPGFAAFHAHAHSAAAAAAFGNGGGASGLDFGGGGFGGAFGGGGLGGLGGLGTPAGQGAPAAGGGGGLDDGWGDLQQQLPSDLGAMLGAGQPAAAQPAAQPADALYGGGGSGRGWF